MPTPAISRRRLPLLAILVGCAATLSVTACGDDNEPPDDEGSVEVAVTPGNLTVAQGASGNATVAITRVGSFADAVTLSQSGAPAGVGVTFAPEAVAAGATSSAVTVAVGAAVAAGSYPVTINAAGTGVTTATTTLTVAVVAAGGGSIALAAAPAALTVAAGAAAVTSAITLTRTAPFAGPVAMTVTGAPAGVTASVAPASVTGTTATLSVSATAAALNGTYPLVVRGAGTGVTDATTTVNATVTGGSTQGIAFAFNPTPLPVTAGGASGNSTVTITRNGGFTGGVNLALTGAPAGLTASVTPNSNVTGTTATITAQASGAVAAGTYNLTLTGTGTGIANATGTLPVTVSGGGGGNVTVTFCADNAPLWFATQDGTGGAWTRLTPTGTTYQVSLPAGRGGVAFVQQEGTETELTVLYATVAEFTAASAGVGFEGCGSKTVNGSVASVGVTEAAFVGLGPASANLTSASPGFPNFVLNEVPDGSLDLIATRTALGTFSPNRIILRRGLNQATGSTITPGLDFGTQGFLPGTANTVTVSGLGADQAIVTGTFSGTNGSTRGGIGTIIGYTAASGAVPYSAIPLAQINPGELQDLSVFAGDATNTNAARFAGTYFRTPADKTIPLGPDLSAPTVTKVVTAPLARPRLQLPGQAEYNKLIFASYSQGTPTSRGANVFATAAYFGAAPTTWDVTLPDLSAAAGWNSAWGLQDGTPIDWNVTAQGGTATLLTAPTDGGAFQSAGVSSGSTPLTVRNFSLWSRW